MRGILRMDGNKVTVGTRAWLHVASDRDLASIELAVPMVPLTSQY